LPKHFLYSLLRYDSLRRGPTHKSMRKQLRRTHASVDRDRNCSLCWRSWNSLCCQSLSRPRLPSYIPASVGPWSLPLCLSLSLNQWTEGSRRHGGRVAGILLSASGGVFYWSFLISFDFERFYVHAYVWGFILIL
jgi:hypothetical protein